MSNLDSLKQDLKNVLKDYKKNNLVVCDSDITKFINILSDYDNANNTSYLDNLYADLELCSFEDIKDYIINQSDSLGTLLNTFSDVQDPTAEYYISNRFGGFKNIEVIDLIDFVSDYIYLK